jgi:quercetin dioxygenase-like cupin family protein
MDIDLRTVALPPGRRRPYDRAEWEGALVLVVRGEVELEAACGERRRFRRGDVLALAGLPLEAVRNPGEATAVLVAVSRRPPPPDR